MDYAYYGGRGISIDLRWMEYEGFLADMGERPEGTTLDRTDGDFIYTKSNCTWATRKEQSRNREYTLDIEFEGETRKVWEWAEYVGITLKAFHHRLWRYRTNQINYGQVFVVRGQI